MSPHPPLSFRVIGKCQTTRARVGLLTLVQPASIGGEVTVETPVFMPVGTSGTMKGVLPEQVAQTGCRLLLSNTYHLGLRPGEKVMSKSGGLHSFMNWPYAILTDSGGFQMVSLSALSVLTEEGVSFKSPYDEKDSEMMLLTPEKSMQIQESIGANLMMQLDDVVDARLWQNEQETNEQKDNTAPQETGQQTDNTTRFQEAVDRSVRWYDRCRETHEKAQKEGDCAHQSLLPIIQGGLSEILREKSIQQLLSRRPPAIAIGGLSGGEAKESFISTVSYCTQQLQREPSLPRYLMGVGHAIDMLLCVALGCDMFDCVFPTRTARFGCALVGSGQQLNMNEKQYADDFSEIEEDCDCVTCAHHTRSYIHHLFRSHTTNACHALTLHNISFQMRWMQKIRTAIKQGELPLFINSAIQQHYGDDKQLYPQWIKHALDILKLNDQ